MIINNKIILGIDPGTVVMGYAVIEVCGDRVSIASMDVLKLGGTKDIYARLEMIHSKVNALISQHQPNTFAIEAPFFGKNVQSMLKLGRAQGVAMAAALARQLPIIEYAPKKVKQSVTGNGNASKEQVAKMLMTLFALTELPKLLDATDALAVALCHHYQKGPAKTGSASWETFLRQNPNRIKTIAK